MKEEKMASARGNSENRLVYEQRWLAMISSNKWKLDSLKLPSMRDVVLHGHPKKTKRFV
jgi:hypothetical protein